MHFYCVLSSIWFMSDLLAMQAMSIMAGRAMVGLHRRPLITATLLAPAFRLALPLCKSHIHYNPFNSVKSSSHGRRKFCEGSIRIHASASTEVSQSSNREVMVQHLLLKEDQLDLALDLERKINEENADLSDLATEYSICSSKSDGGMLGWIAKGKTVPEFEEAAFTAPLNKVVRIKTKFGWHLLQVLSERESVLGDIQPEELFRRLQDANFLSQSQLMDVREPDEISRAAIQGFQPYPLSQFGQWAPNITETLDPAKETYVLCHHGVRSLQTAQWLKSQGFKRVYNIVGGIHAYAIQVDQSVPTY